MPAVNRLRPGLWVPAVLVAALAVAPWPTLILSHSSPPAWYVIAIPVYDGAKVSPVFSRSPQFAIVDVKANTTRIVSNPARDRQHGTGLESARLLLEEKVGVVIAREIGPEPFRKLTRRGVGVYVGSPSTLTEAIYQLRGGMLAKAKAPTTPTHYGIRKLGLAVHPEKQPCPLAAAPTPAPSPAVTRQAPAPAPNPIQPFAAAPPAIAAPVTVPPLTAPPAPVSPVIAGPYQLPKLAMEVVGTSSGVGVYRVYPGSAAERAGLRPGDVILGFGPNRIIDVGRLVDAVRAAREEESVTIEVFRAGQVFRKQAVVGEGEMESVTLPPNPAPQFNRWAPAQAR
jgi:predicted Fe-Mo cluster-binding NifX family protein